MRIKNLDLLGAILIVALNVGWMWLPARPWFIGLPLVLPLVLILPGYTLTQVLFRKKAPGQEPEQVSKGPSMLKLGHPIGGADQLILSLGLSMALDILVGFVLNILPIGLQAFSWALALGVCTVFFALLALLVRRNDGTVPGKRPQIRVTLINVLLILVAVFILGNAILLAVNRSASTQQSFTQLWMMPVNEISKDCAVSLGVQSFETDATNYTLTVTVNHQPVTTNWSTIALEPQQKWVQSLSLQPQGQSELYVEAQLYRADHPQTVYRNVHLTFHVATIAQNGQSQLQCLLRS